MPPHERELSAEGAGVCHADARHAIAASAASPVEPAPLPSRKSREAVAQSLAAPVRPGSRGWRNSPTARAAARIRLRGSIEAFERNPPVPRGLRRRAGEREIAAAGIGWRQLEEKYARRRGSATAPAFTRFRHGGSARRRCPRAARVSAALRLASPDVVAAADIVARARTSDSNAGKSQAARDLLMNAHWYFALWAVAGLLLLQFGRQAVHARRFLPVAALLWAGLGWLTHVHIEWISDRAAQTASLLRWGVRFPQFFQFAIAGAALLLMLGILFAPGRAAAAAPPVRQTPSSRLGYAGFVLFVGLGWWMLLDLSAAGHVANRFHALYQQVYVFAAFAVLTMLAPMRLQLADRLGRWLGWLLLLTRRVPPAYGASCPEAGAGAAALLATAGACARPAYLGVFRRNTLRRFLGIFVRGESALAIRRRRPVRAGCSSGAFACCACRSRAWCDDDWALFTMLYAASIFVGFGSPSPCDQTGYRPWLHRQSASPSPAPGSTC